MTAYEQEMKRLAERIGRLEEHREALEKLVSDVGSIVDRSVDDDVETSNRLKLAVVRIQALETHLTRSQEALVQLDVEGLERRKTLDELCITKAKYDVEHWLPEMPERERQDRWHATRDAVLTGCYAKPSGIGPYGLEYWMREATSAADRAHGPLEAHPQKIHDTPAVDRLVAAAINAQPHVASRGVKRALFEALRHFRQGGEGDAVLAAEESEQLGPIEVVNHDVVEDVAALVKAARACFDWYEVKPQSVLQFEVLLNALKPFEREQE